MTFLVVVASSSACFLGDDKHWDRLPISSLHSTQYRVRCIWYCCAVGLSIVHYDTSCCDKDDINPPHHIGMIPYRECNHPAMYRNRILCLVQILDNIQLYRVPWDHHSLPAMLAPHESDHQSYVFHIVSHRHDRLDPSIPHIASRPDRDWPTIPPVAAPLQYHERSEWKFSQCVRYLSITRKTNTAQDSACVRWRTNTLGL